MSRGQVFKYVVILFLAINIPWVVVSSIFYYGKRARDKVMSPHKPEPMKTPSYTNVCYNEEIFTKELYGKIGGKKEKIAEIQIGTCWIRFYTPFHLNETRKEQIQTVALYVDGFGPRQILYNLSVELYIIEKEKIQGKLIENPFDEKSSYRGRVVYKIKGDSRFYEGEEFVVLSRK